MRRCDTVVKCPITCAFCRSFKKFLHLITPHIEHAQMNTVIMGTEGLLYGVYKVVTRSCFGVIR